MELYLKFITTLTFGLLGIGLVLKVLLDGLFHDWDVGADFRAFTKRISRSKSQIFQKTEDVLIDLERDKPRELTTRLVDQRRQELRELAQVEGRLHDPAVAAALEAEDWGRS